MSEAFLMAVCPVVRRRPGAPSTRLVVAYLLLVLGAVAQAGTEAKARATEGERSSTDGAERDPDEPGAARPADFRGPAIGGGALASGFAPVAGPSGAPVPESSDWPATGPGGAPAPGSSDVPAPGPSRTPEPEPVGEVTLGEAISAALVRNPELAAFSQEVRAREARVLQAGLLPNPELRLDVEDIGGTGNRQGFEETQTTLRLSQLVELGGKREGRRRVAELGGELASWDYERRRLLVLSEVRKAFVAALAAQERLSLAGEIERVAAETVRAVEARVAAGASPEVEVARARVALGRAQVESTRAERELAAARSGLAATWGGLSPRFTRVVGDLAWLRRVPGREDLLERLRRSPDLARWTTEIEERSTAVTLEEAQRVPDVTVGVGGRHFSDNGDDALVLELGVALPVFDRNQGGIAEARHRLAKAQAEREAAEVAARASLAAAYERLLAAHAESARLESNVIPQAKAAVDGALVAYRQGLLGYLDVLDAQRTLFELRSEHVRALEAFHAAVADVERLTAQPLVGTIEGGGS